MAYYLELTKKKHNTRLESWDNKPFGYFCATNRFRPFPHNYMSFATSRNWVTHVLPSIQFSFFFLYCRDDQMNRKRIDFVTLFLYPHTLYKEKRSKSKVSLYDVWLKSGSSTLKLQGRSTTPILVNDIAKLCWPLRPIPLHRKTNNILSYNWRNKKNINQSDYFLNPFSCSSF